MQSVERGLRGLERRLGINREGRTVWVWAIPAVSGMVIGVLFGVMPGIPVAADVGIRLGFALFGLVATTAVSVICLMSFDNDRNQQADTSPRR
ncbi:MAG: hypothetical protein JOZ46_02250 [Candidatus Dormibacteraeota bacterium]|nr:hypothetical protein [Candidatus Dormibacteraeota bacterium]MBV9524618.1 hypothetical protein [Candidatus Dormibacteraeota bacterium]